MDSSDYRNYYKKSAFANLHELSIFLALAILFYSPIVLGLRTFPDGDFTHHFLPFSLFQRQELLAGRLPLWNPYTYSGHPFLADIQAAVFYPISNFFLLFTLSLAEVGQRMYVLQLEAVLHVALAGWFTTLLVSDLTANRWAGRMAGIIFAFSGYVTGYPPLQLAILRTAVWLPLILYFLQRAFDRLTQASPTTSPTSSPASSMEIHPRTLRWWVFAALAYATAFLAGHPQTFLHITYVLGAYCVVRIAYCIVANLRSPISDLPTLLLKMIAGCLLFFLLALALSAAQLIPSIEFTRLSVRADTSYDFVSGGFPLQDSWQLLLPGVLTQFSPIYIGVVGLGLAILGIGTWALGGKNVSSQKVGARGRREESVSVGNHNFSAHLMPVLSSIETIRKNKKEKLVSHTEENVLATRNSQFAISFFLALVLIALLLSFGHNAFLYPLFYQIAPGWSLFRGQERAAFLVAFALSVLAGYGAASIVTLPLSWRRRLTLWACTAMIAGVYAFGLLWQLQDKSAVSDWAFLANAAISVLVAVSMALILWPTGWTERRAGLLAGLIIANLVWANLTTNLTQFGPARKTILAPEMVAIGEAIAARQPADSRLPARAYNEFRVYEDYGMRQQIEDVWGSSPLRLATYAALVETLPLDRLWQLTGVEHLLTWRRDLDISSERVAEFPQVNDTTYLHRLYTVQPRIWLASAWQAADDTLTAELLRSPTFDVNTTALLSVDSKVDFVYTDPTEFSAQAWRAASNQIQLQIESKQGGILIVSENWMPGWQITNLICDSANCAVKPSPVGNLPAFTVLRANLTFIGIVLPAGEYQFNLVYQPSSVRFGLLISATTLLLILGAGIWRIRRRIR